MTHAPAARATMKTTTIALLTVAGSVAMATAQQVDMRIIPGLYPLDVSADGSVVVGNSAVFETVRWTEASGFVSLGRGTWTVFGAGAGTPDVSDDGTRLFQLVPGDQREQMVFDLIVQATVPEVNQWMGLDVTT